MFGKPTELFNPRIIREGAHGQRFQSSGRVPALQYLDWAERVYASRNGVFGFKLLSEDFQFVARIPGFLDYLAGCEIVRLTRDNKLAQAVSCHFATTTGQWMANDPPQIKANGVPYN